MQISHLPSELLARIFHLSLDAQPCDKRDYDPHNPGAGLAYPRVFAHVCSRWRKIALLTPTLWCHIDISTSPQLSLSRLNSLALLHLNHVGQLPLDLHVFDSVSYPVSQGDNRSSLHELIAQVASRTCSFNLDANYTYDPGIHGPILSAFFKSSVPGKLVRLIMRHEHDYGSGYIRADDDADDDGLDVGLPMEQLENLLSGVSVLHVNRLFPRRTSRAYHRLTELRLCGDYFSIISESELIAVLQSSPGLRILEVGLDIGNSLPIGTQVATVSLSKLEALNVSQVGYNQLATLLRWLAPGPKPLQLAVYPPARTEDYLELKDTLSAFLLRSRVTRMYGTRWNLLTAIRLIGLSPNLQELVVFRMKPDRLKPLRREDEITGGLLDRHLGYFRIIYSSVHMEDILALVCVSTFLVETIAFYWCKLHHNGAEVPIYREDSLLEELRRSYPQVKFIIRRPEKPYPAKSWDLCADTTIF